jgi:biopolymer transport protein ExbB
MGPVFSNLWLTLDLLAQGSNPGQGSNLGQGSNPGAESIPPETAGLIEIVFSGGIIGLLILLLLLALSITAAYLTFDQIMTLRRNEIMPAGLAEAVRQALLTGRVAEADAACRRSPSVLGFVLHNGLTEWELGWSQVEKAMEEALAEQSARLMRRIEYLSVIGNIAPWLVCLVL